MIPAKLRKMLDLGARRRLRAAALERADALERGDAGAADAATERYVSAEWARKTPRIVPTSAPLLFTEGPSRPPGFTWWHTMSGEITDGEDDR